MPRPLRIEYENAYYHVMNRGRARQTVFHDDEYVEAFLTTLSEAHQRFGVEILCYCLLKNHYHLLLRTPEANLGRVMRHINGVYTQRHNRLKKTDGPLFRGRYKAICVEADSYQLQLSRYIHRNPLEAKLIQDLDHYTWSSYPYYVRSRAKPPAWLYQSDIYGQLGAKSRRKAKYRAYVELGVDAEIKQFYAKDHARPYLGSDTFRAWVYSQKVTDDAAISRQEKLAFRPSMDAVIGKVANKFNVNRESILHTERGGVNNVPRWVAMYLSQELCGCRLVEIAAYFGLKRTGSIPTTIGKLKRLMSEDQALMRLVNELQQRIEEVS